jgi:hypothetical protein
VTVTAAADTTSAEHATTRDGATAAIRTVSPRTPWLRNAPGTRTLPA